MTTKNFSKGEAIRFGWQIMKSDFWFFAALLILAGVIQFGPDVIYQLLIKGLIKESPILAFTVDLIGWILSIIVGLGLIKISLNFCDNLKSKIGDLFSQYQLFFRAFFAGILYGLICLLGMILFIIPGIYLGIRFWFYDYFIVDKKAGVIESLKKSWRITKGSVWNLFLFILILIGINLLGILCFLIGLFATIPTTILATAIVYRKLLSQSPEGG
ncbi:MAG: hypothetical protein QME57_00345 [Patescibacteria group bacterium]|nr:hypothetical protein [Patescibacteria group bacterium]